MMAEAVLVVHGETAVDRRGGADGQCISAGIGRVRGPEAGYGGTNEKPRVGSLVGVRVRSVVADGGIGAERVRLR